MSKSAGLSIKEGRAKTLKKKKRQQCHTKFSAIQEHATVTLWLSLAMTLVSKFK